VDCESFSWSDVSGKFTRRNENRMKTTLILLIATLCSCNSKSESESTSQLTYEMLAKENVIYINYLSENIQSKIQKNNKDARILKYDSLTKGYLNYITIIETEIKRKSTQILFENNDYSQKGKEFIQNAKEYKACVEMLGLSENFRKRVNLVLNVNDLQAPEKGVAQNNETGKIIVGKTYLKYLNYYFQDLSNIQALALISNRKKNILELENEFISTTNIAQ